MTTNAILNRFDDLSIWKQGDQSGPHKPLLVLYALGRWQAGQKDISFRQTEPDLTLLLREFGLSRKSDHPKQPFWRLQRDGVWTVHAPAGLETKKGDRTGHNRPASPSVPSCRLQPDPAGRCHPDDVPPGVVPGDATGVEWGLGPQIATLSGSQ